jgi:hypothetical protein
MKKWLLIVIATAAALLIFFCNRAVMAGAKSPSGADSEENSALKEQQKSDEPIKKIRDHRFQGVINVLFGTGFYMVAPYDKNDKDKACGYNAEKDEYEPVCSGRSGMHFDFLAGFGLKKGFELVLMYRQGVESLKAGRPKPMMFGAGFKLYKPADGLFKMGFGVIPLFDFSKRTDEGAKDFVIHVPILAQFDFVRWFGAYLQIAPNVSFISEFRFDINFGVGVQGRFP